MIAQEIIRSKRDGHALESEAIVEFVNGIVDGIVSNEQTAAFAMAVYFSGMDARETAALTLAMRDSGSVIEWSDRQRTVDKHSTGGVGDKVSLLLAPLAAACGLQVPMISGRGLGHTGGTLDKLEAIPGYNCRPPKEKFAEVVTKVGCAIVGQTDVLAPADRRLYAIRDVTATVESVPLITASILAKKLAAGLGSLVMDVKTGSGAFMTELADSRQLANSLVATGAEAGLPVVALITDMNSPLGTSAGNGLEVIESIDMLTATTTDQRLKEVTIGLVVQMLLLAKVVSNPEAALDLANQRWDDGSAAEKFSEMVAMLGGPTDLLDNSAQLPVAPVTLAVVPAAAGFVSKVDTRQLGLVVLELGGGRTQTAAAIDHAVGLTELAAIGDEVGKSTKPLAIVHAQAETAAKQAAASVLRAYQLGERPPTLISPIIEQIGV